MPIGSEGQILAPGDARYPILGIGSYVLSDY